MQHILILSNKYELRSSSNPPFERIPQSKICGNLIGWNKLQRSHRCAALGQLFQHHRLRHHCTKIRNHIRKSQPSTLGNHQLHETKPVGIEWIKRGGLQFHRYCLLRPSLPQQEQSFVRFNHHNSQRTVARHQSLKCHQRCLQGDAIGH